MREITELDELKQIELDIMKKIHSFCEEHEIKYYLAYGTLIGAVRHQGFIPWDDDIDIQLMREDYEKFLKLFPAEARKNGLELVNESTNRFYCRPMSKVIDSRTELKEKEFRGDDIIGVFVDLFPLDGVSPNRFHQRITLWRLKFWKLMLLANIKEYGDFNILGCVLRFLTSVISNKKKVKIFNRIASSMPIKQTVKCYSDPYNVEADVSLYKDVIKLQFEDAAFWAPAGYDEILTKTYGDYMKLPPEDKRIPHHVSDVYWK